MATETTPRPRIGVPYRTKKEQLTGHNRKLEKYLASVRGAGGDAVPVSLTLSDSELTSLARTLDGVALSGSPADVNPARFGAERHLKCVEPDEDRERVDFALLRHCFEQQKPVLAICYGIQSLNVFLSGNLVQDIPSKIGKALEHDGKEHGAHESFHSVAIEPDSKLLQIAGTAEARVNSSHHQAVEQPGRGLRVIARAHDGVIEAVEWTGSDHWIVGVQWHPERMVETDEFARKLFREAVNAAAARKSLARV